MDINTTREQWLNSAITLIKLDIMYDQKHWQNIRATVSATRGGRQITRSIAPDDSQDSTHEILVSIHTNDTQQILARLLHELIHVQTGDVDKHSKHFNTLANRYGLTKPLSAPTTTVDTATQRRLSEIEQAIGQIPHAPVNYTPASGGRNNSTMNCLCGFKSNLSNKWATKIQDTIASRGGVNCPVCMAPSITITIK